MKNKKKPVVIEAILFDANKRLYEDKLLTEIAMISSLEDADKYKKEFHSQYHCYNFETYLAILSRVKNLLLKGFNSYDDIVRTIRSGADLLIK